MKLPCFFDSLLKPVSAFFRAEQLDVPVDRLRFTPSVAGD